MEQGLGFDSLPTSGNIDKSKILNIKPLRIMVPIFPSSHDTSAFSTTQTSAFMCVPPTGTFPSGVPPFYPFFVSNDSQKPKKQKPQMPIGVRNRVGRPRINNPIPSPVPLNSFKTPMPQGPSQSSWAGNGDMGSSRRSSRNRTAGFQSEQEGYVADEDNYSDSQYMHVTDVEVTSNGGRPKRSRKKKWNDPAVKFSTPKVDIDSIVISLISSFNLIGLDSFKQAEGDKELVGCLLLAFDLLRRKITQIDDGKDLARGATNLKAAGLLMTKGIRTNSKKRVGAVPGVEVGDIFFFRIEMCLVGLHSLPMAGIDYISVKFSIDEEPVAVSIVSSGGYEDDGDDGNVLIYSGQGGVRRKDGRMMDQKLEGGNLALEKSLHRASEVRVIRGLRDFMTPNGKIYVYDGLYRVQESWVEKGKSGCNVFKYKLVRVPGQPEAFAIWKLIQQWRDGITLRNGVILPDLTSGAENLPVSLVNDVDGEMGPAHFTYLPILRYSKPFAAPNPSLSCTCLGGCQPGDSKCPCVQKNGGYLPHTSLGVLLSYKSLVHECGSSCSCPPNCRNRVSQAGLKVRLEVFKMKDKGWGLRSLDPIRGGSFICEYAGEVIDSSMLDKLGHENDDNYIFDATRTYEPLEAVSDNSNESAKVPFPVVISAKYNGNVARFMNHSCSPNVFWQPVLRENNMESSLHIAFYAIRHIPPMQELTYDYGTVLSDKANQRRKNCFCGSLKCRGYFH